MANFCRRKKTDNDSLFMCHLRRSIQIKCVVVKILRIFEKTMRLSYLLNIKIGHHGWSMTSEPSCPIIGMNAKKGLSRIFSKLDAVINFVDDAWWILLAIDMSHLYAPFN